MDTLIKKIKDLNIGESYQVNMLSRNHLGDQDESYQNMDPSQIFEIQANFQDEPHTINKVHYGQNTNGMALLGPSRYYYPRPTHVDVLYEEDFLQNQRSYYSKTIYEWNIDGLSEYQIYEILQHMLMFATVCKQNENTDHQVACFIVSDFTGILKGWWDNIFEEERKEEILTTTKPITDELTGLVHNEQDAICSLVNTIVLHFVGAISGIEDRSRELLQKLRCPSLSHFRWYKDVFMMKVSRRSDANLEHWKAKFIDGLPTLFAERERKKLRDRHNQLSIPYSKYTYGQLIGLSEQELIVKSMDFMKEQFLQSISKDDASESQDPTDNDPNFSDFWDSLTSLISDKIEKDKKRKGKEE
ncbi:uncharacterized protein LOC114289973 [Camellia sinensis]|uniref:uncharacterized protein LOC114289973 n=1 Tax=Camellia sinensis TaxID=4442 RepID=UPI0010356D5D|nr:uncharacterized protein LOC114289973 [Camellia sinensis]